MAQLGSPGVAVSVIDESFYTPAAPGTTPLIIVATAENKANGAGTGTAPGTLKANAGKVYLLTSQMDLGTTFGTPYFETDASNNPVHAGERNEYGLQAAYSYLGVSSRAYVVRADVDLGALKPTATEPKGAPTDGTYWLDTADSLFGIFEWNGASATTSGGQTFTNKIPTVISDPAYLDGMGAPITGFGSTGNYALVVTETPYKLYYKKPATTDTSPAGWVLVGSNDWTASWPTITGSGAVGLAAGSSLTITATPTPSQTIAITATTAPITLSSSIFTGSSTSLINGAGFTAAGIVTGTIVKFSGAIAGLDTAKSYVVLTATDTTFGVADLITPTVAKTLTATSGLTVGGTLTTATAGVITSADTHRLTVGESITFTTGTAFGGVAKTTSYTVTTIAGGKFSISPAGGSTLVTLTTATGTLSGVSGDASITLEELTVAECVNEINTSGVNGITAAMGVDDQLVIYTDGTVDKLQLSYTGTGLTDLLGNGVTTTTYYSPALQISAHTSVPKFKAQRPTGSVWIKSTDANLGANYRLYQYSATSASFKQLTALMYKDHATALSKLDKVGGGLQLPAGTTYIKFNDDEYGFYETPTTQGLPGDRANPGVATFKLYTRTSTGPTVVTKAITSSTFVSGAKIFQMAESLAGSDTFSAYQTVSFTDQGSAGATSLVNSLPNFVNINVTFTNGELKFSHKLGGEIKFIDGTGAPLAELFGASLTHLYDAPMGSDATWIASNWKATDAISASTLTTSNNPPSSTTADGALWYNAEVSEVDIMINTGSKWVGMKHMDSPVNDTDDNGPIVSATKPTKQSDGTTDLVEGDLWVDTSDLENYPKLYKFANARWTAVDTSDQTSENGVLFHDARWTDSGEPSIDGTYEPATIKTLLSTDYVDFDAPDPLLYPEGMLLWNTRRSSFNVKEFKQNYINVLARNPRMADATQLDYYPHRWVSIAANQENGAGTFGRKSQRAVVVQALQALINSNQAIRDEDSLLYNLLACPGYPEAVNELVNLNYDRALASFIVADTPARLASDATTLSNWGNNTSHATDNNDNGLVTTDPYVAFYYPWGYSSDNLGNNVVVPPSHMMLRTIALSDNVSYPWFAPAGTRRGGITNASAVGYVDAQTGEFQSVALNTGQRDTLAAVHVNPITFISGTGLVAYGQYTRQLAASSLDRVNVARLVVYLRRQFTQLAKPYVFEPNDTITRNEIKQAAESLLLELVGQRAIYDYLVVCDGTNNTPARIDRSELYLDVAIEPVKAAEFIYIPLRLENTGAIKGLGQ